jgi:hypothetical protein
MCRFHPALIPAALLAFLAGCTSTPASSMANNAGPGPTATAVGNEPEHVLQKGMTAAEVKRLMGEPAEIKPMTAPTGTAEVWIYHHTTYGPMEQIQVGTRSTSTTMKGADGQDHVVQTVEEPVYRHKVQIVEETTRLLMFDGILIEQHQAVQKRMEYQ